MGSLINKLNSLNNLYAYSKYHNIIKKLIDTPEGEESIKKYFDSLGVLFENMIEVPSSYMIARAFGDPSVDVTPRTVKGITDIGLDSYIRLRDLTHAILETDPNFFSHYDAIGYEADSQKELMITISILIRKLCNDGDISKVSTNQVSVKSLIYILVCLTIVSENYVLGSEEEEFMMGLSNVLDSEY
jgi:hypothetical protein